MPCMAAKSMHLHPDCKWRRHSCYLSISGLCSVPIGDAMTHTARARAGLSAGPPQLEVTRFAPANRQRLSAPAFRTFLSIADLWGLAEEERRLVLGYPSRSTFHGWAKRAREHEEFTLDVDTLTRISAILGIHQALGVLYAGPKEMVAWLRGPNNAIVFGGNPPLRVITSGTLDALLTVRRFLDAARGGIYMQPNEVDDAFAPYEASDIVFR